MASKGKRSGLQKAIDKVDQQLADLLTQYNTDRADLLRVKATIIGIQKEAPKRAKPPKDATRVPSGTDSRDVTGNREI